MLKRCYLCFGLILLTLLLTSCSQSMDSQAASHPISPTAMAVRHNQASMTDFSLTGALQQHYQLQSTATISKLRHGHKEFTINIVDTTRSLIIVFYGYSGPGSYTLTNRSNGGM
ncbi:hypothetical protein KDW_46000 [Dictyobacter vulcani]|uniref:Uncharacterized protein n=1 Tax=Dictyobacter vulcani TaxID=2607529 RepID=A0A5J4KL52_9CHLR|nr:hypothetical protein [Dictyobacter vulcani]GER90438.1 hypothetical protein KDW_46000 [Dictyobacter vulcani]